ncbi:hypothetical protein BDV95DRAFT_605801 [Massariosphaeria phaeospora]|uniref:Uncharacterized protein n=1 Tax=Massariosphaeria phaeospora TaxID=100035 RepID=A0A7C8MRI4_9PLEO|nr:hypothetical protein BDV95DRAFT_605801 [Massariosphaeria phaeospora]
MFGPYIVLSVLSFFTLAHSLVFPIQHTRSDVLVHKRDVVYDKKLWDTKLKSLADKLVEDTTIFIFGGYCFLDKVPGRTTTKDLDISTGPDMSAEAVQNLWASVQAVYIDSVAAGEAIPEDWMNAQGAAMVASSNKDDVFKSTSVIYQSGKLTMIEVSPEIQLSSKLDRISAYVKADITFGNYIPKNAGDAAYLLHKINGGSGTMSKAKVKELQEKYQKDSADFNSHDFVMMAVPSVNEKYRELYGGKDGFAQDALDAACAE